MSTKQSGTEALLELLKAEGVSPSGGTEFPYIVYVDDEKELFEPLTHVAASFGFKSYCTTSVDSALDFIEKHQHEIAYIISDFKMDPLNGFEFRAKLLAAESEIPFAILSGNITRELALAGIEHKISGFLEKPITADNFAELMSKDGLTRIRALKDDRELLHCFIDEATTNLEAAEDLALAFEENLNDLDAVNKCFGLVHTLKGASGYFKPKTLHQFVHRFEDLLKKIQRGETALGPEVVSSILKSFDFVKVQLQEFKTREHKTYDLQTIFLEYFTFGDQARSPSISSPAAIGTAAVAAAPKVPDKEAQSVLKIPVKVLDDFMQVSGEMTVIRNMINKCVKSIEGHFPGDKDVFMLSELLEELHGVNAFVQTQIRNLRMVPIHNILKPISRVVRDVTKALSKEVELITQGDDLAVDTAIASALGNSIIHLVRNSLDHGVELPEEREKAGKPRKGKVVISASVKNEVIHIGIEDDGKGINEASIRKKLVKNGSHTEQEAASLVKGELYAMIFEAGFSTAEKVTDISGRGVGMSMVKDSISAVGGRIDIESFPGKGSKFTLLMPVPKSVLIRDCLFVESEGLVFGIPQDDVLRVVRLPTGDASALFNAQGALTIHYDDHLVPVVDLAYLLETNPDSKSIENVTEHISLIVVGDNQKRIALKVDSVLDIEDTVIKPLQGPAKKIEVFQGAAFMGDGSIGLILSSEGLLKKGRILTANVPAKRAPVEKVEVIASSSVELLLLNVGDQSLYAVPTRVVYRIEEIDSVGVRVSGGAHVVPYRDKILNLLSLSDILKGRSWQMSEEPQKLQTIVIEKKNHFLGLVVDSIVDIAKTEGDLLPAISYQFGLDGNYLIGEKTITVINLGEIIASVSKNGEEPVEPDQEASLAPAA